MARLLWSGHVDYELAAPEPGMYRLEIETRAHRPHWDKEYELRLSIDDEFLSRET